MRYPIISMRELDCWISCKRPMELIDLRAPGAYEYCHLTGAVNIPFEELEDMIEEGRLCEFQKGVPLVLYCQRGSQSLLACNHLSLLGLPVISVAGGKSAYRGSWLEWG